MPNTNSAKKRLRQNVGRRARNRAGASALKTQLKRARTAVAGGDSATTATEVRAAVKKIDQSAAKGLIHRNAAARLKSRLVKSVKIAQGK